MAQLGTPLGNAPSDGITAVRFARDAELLLASSWDSTLRLYDVLGENCLTQLKLSSPILDCNFRDSCLAYSGGLDGQVLSHDFQSEVPPMLLGNHQRPIKCIEFNADKGWVVSGGWDRIVKFWDPRRATHRMQVTSFELPGKVYSAAQAFNRLVVATAERHIFIFDIRKCDSERDHAPLWQCGCRACTQGNWNAVSDEMCEMLQKWRRLWGDIY